MGMVGSFVTSTFKMVMGYSFDVGFRIFEIDLDTWMCWK